MTTSPRQKRSGSIHLAQIGDCWHVMFEPDDLPHHYVSIARFQEYSRARQYAEVEEMCGDDNERREPDVVAVPKIDVRAIAPNKPLSERPTAPPPRSNMLRKLSPLEEEIKSDLASLMDDHEYGMTVNDLVEYYGEQESDVKYAIRMLCDRAIARIVRRPDEKRERVVPYRYKLPPIPANAAQKSLLGAMLELEIDGKVSASHRLLSDRSGVPQGSMPVVLATLIGSGAIEKVVEGGNGEPNVYRISSHPDTSPLPAGGARQPTPTPSPETDPPHPSTLKAGE